jgi:DNA-directed RNA polymerase subunit H (RpoH/RPB5)
VLAIIGLGTLTMENLPKEVARAPIASNIGTPTGMAVVVIRAPRAAGRI